MAQEVAHLIGSEEVTGSTPVISSEKSLRNQGLHFLCPVFYFVWRIDKNRKKGYVRIDQVKEQAMKILHLSDLHLGKRLNEFSLIEDQRYILMEETLRLIERKNPEAVILAGDIFDKSIAGLEAITLLEEFLEELVIREKKVLMIAGNHDSVERLSFGSSFMQAKGIYNAKAYGGRVEKVSLQDEYGKLHFYLLPFIKPVSVRRFWGEDIGSYQQAMQRILENCSINKEERNILITHQFITGASRTESEEISVGGTDNIDGSLFRDFDYVALGHLHRAQNIYVPFDTMIRYPGTLLKYSFSESTDDKTFSLLDIREKGNIELEELPVKALRDLRVYKGSLANLLQEESGEDYMEVILTDEEQLPDTLARVRKIYPNLMRLSYDNRRTRTLGIEEKAENIEQLSPMDLFRQFYREQNGGDCNGEQEGILRNLIEEIWG